MRRLPRGSKFVRLSAATVPQLAAERSGPTCSAPLRRGVGPTFGGSVAVPVAIFIGAAARVIPALLAGVVQRELNWLESDITWPVAISIAVSALAAPLAAIGLARVDVRVLILASLVVLAASLALSSLAT